jgi:hypothetical protein
VRHVNTNYTEIVKLLVLLGYALKQTRVRWFSVFLNYSLYCKNFKRLLGVMPLITPEHENDPHNRQSGEVLPPEQTKEVIGATFWDFLQTQSGETIAHKLLDMVQLLQKSTIEANADQSKKQLENAAVAQRQNVEFQQNAWRFWMWLQGIIFVTCIVATVALAWHDKLSSTASVVITTTLGFLFGRSTVKGQ